MKNLSLTNVLPKISWIFVLLINCKAFACDVCSCGAANNSIFTNAIHGNFIGFGYDYMGFNFKEGIAINSPLGLDRIHTATLTGQFQLDDRFLISATVPYKYNTRTTTKEQLSTTGIGDVSIYGLANVLDTESNHVLKVGLGIKLPTGAFDIAVTEVNKTSAIQLGTGSFDLVFPVQYAYRKGDFSANANATYYAKGKNNKEFKYGNQLQLNVNFSYGFVLNQKFVMAPYLGISHDDFKPTERFGIVDKRSSGYMTNANIGVQLETQNYIYGLKSQLPIVQNLIDNEVLFKNSVGVFLYKRF